MHEPPPLDLSDAASVAAVLHHCAATLRDDPLRRGASVHLPAEGRLTVTGDLHDNGFNLARIRKVAALNASPDHHLVLHEVIHGENFVNGADLSIRTLAQVADLRNRFPGQVHLMQSNHELAQHHGEGIQKDGIGVVEAFDDGLHDLYADAADEVAAAVRDYVRSLPLCVRVAAADPGGGGLFVAHSLPAPRQIERFDKAVIDRELTDADLAPRGSAYDMVWGRHHNTKILHELADAWGAGCFLLGHQPADLGWEKVADLALVLASDHQNGVAVPLDLTRAWTRDAIIDEVLMLNEVAV